MNTAELTLKIAECLLMPRYSKVTLNHGGEYTYGYTGQNLEGSTPNHRIAVKYHAAGANLIFSASRVRLRCMDCPAGTLGTVTLSVWSDAAGSPGVLLSGCGTLSSTGGPGPFNWKVFDIGWTPAFEMLDGSDYWLVIDVDLWDGGGPVAGTIEYKRAAVIGITTKSWTGAAWVVEEADSALYFELGTKMTFADDTLDEPDGFFNGGTLWFWSGGVYTSYVIDRYVAATRTFYLKNFLGVVAVGDQYAVLDARYPRDLLIGALNVALDELGPFDAKNETLTVITDQYEYALPAGVAGVKRLQYSLETVAPFHWSAPDHYWRERIGLLITSPSHPWTAGCKMRLWYEAPHARVYNDIDAITNAVHPRRIAWQAAWAAARARNSRADTTDAQTQALEEKCKQEALALQREHPIQRLGRDESWIDLP